MRCWMQIHTCSFSTECIPNIKRKIILVVYRTCFNPGCVPQRTASKRHLGLHGEHSTFGNIFPVSLVKLASSEERRDVLCQPRAVPSKTLHFL